MRSVSILSRPARRRLVTAGTVSLCAAATLTACVSDKDDAQELAPAAPETTADTGAAPAESVTPETPTADSASDTAAGDEEASVSESTSATSTESSASTNPGAEGIPEDVAEAYDVFKPLAPKDLFQDFSSCESGGMQDTYNCSGPKAGQWQLFKSPAKAAQSTQVLTELRSSQVVEDEGDRVVGWSTLGSTAIITLVDNDKGLVMQQMTSLDQDDPEKRLEELGLVDKENSRK